MTHAIEEQEVRDAAPLTSTTANALGLMTQVLDRAASIFRGKLERILARGGLSRDEYVRYLTMQYWLTMGVQKHFLMAASHPCMEGRRRFREFLYNFALEEEPHFRLAHRDLEAMGEQPLSRPLDVALWWAYYDQVILQRPFVRLGATFILENLGSGIGGLAKELLVGPARSSFLNQGNTRFLILHLHEVLPHGDQILGALAKLALTDAEAADLVEGSKIGSILYLRLASWALRDDPLLEAFPLDGDA